MLLCRRRMRSPPSRTGGGLSPIALPSIGSALLVGPTASGKSHLLKTFARAAGLLFHPIDAGQMTAEGYRGNNFSAQWMQVSAKLESNSGRNALVFIDEVISSMLRSARDEQGLTCSNPWRAACSRACHLKVTRRGSLTATDVSSYSQEPSLASRTSPRTVSEPRPPARIHGRG